MCVVKETFRYKVCKKFTFSRHVFVRVIALGQTRLTARNQLERRIVRNSLPSLGSKIQDWQCCVDNPQTALQSYRRLVDICYGHVNFFSSLGSWFLGQPLLLARCTVHCACLSQSAPISRCLTPHFWREKSHYVMH